MTYLLDTNVCIRFLNGRSPGVLSQIKKRRPADIVVCSIVKSELIYGSYRSQNPTRSLEIQRQFLAPYRSLPFDDTAAAMAGLIRSQLAQLGTPIGPYDVQIAAIALVHECTLVTHNLREFSRISGLIVEDWESTLPHP
ncbi:MAG: type II toxin-antitoxin system VapC family toxin [Ardenticatenaceae bacterium]|nr:type II toxin-antitoxin system VapC family toxin [Ardenticatenaceae bacterium]